MITKATVVQLRFPSRRKASIDLVQAWNAESTSAPGEGRRRWEHTAQRSAWRDPGREVDAVSKPVPGTSRVRVGAQWAAYLGTSGYGSSCLQICPRSDPRHRLCQEAAEFCHSAAAAFVHSQITLIVTVHGEGWASTTVCLAYSNAACAASTAMESPATTRRAFRAPGTAPTARPSTTSTRYLCSSPYYK